MIATEKAFVSVNATTEVDLMGQCASETMAGRDWSSSGGQADFARGAMYFAGGTRRRRPRRWSYPTEAPGPRRVHHSSGRTRKRLPEMPVGRMTNQRSRSPGA